MKPLVAAVAVNQAPRGGQAAKVPQLNRKSWLSTRWTAAGVRGTGSRDGIFTPDTQSDTQADGRQPKAAAQPGRLKA